MKKEGRPAKDYRALVFGLLLALLAGLSGCKGTVGTLGLFSTLPPNTCTSADAALNNPSCQLTLGEWKQGYIGLPQEQVWYGAKLGTLDARSIGHVIAGYFPPADADSGYIPPPYADGSPYQDGGVLPPNCQTDGFNTAVNLTLGILQQDGETSVTTGADIHGTACPVPMDFTFRYTQSDTSLIVVLEDNTGVGTDTKNQYSLWLDMLEDPDVNEPNDTPQTATPIPLTTTGGVASGQNGGYLATPGDMDYFVVQSPGANNVLWLELSQDLSSPSPPPYPFRLQYFVYGPDGQTQVATGDSPAGSQYSTTAVVVGTAILLNQVGPYYIMVQGYRDQNTVGAVPGSLTYKYLLQVIEVPLQDPTEGTAQPYNNTFASAYPVNGGAAIALNGNATVTGRTSYVADLDWYAVTLAANPALALLHYKLTPNQSAGRFPALPTPPNRSLFVYTEMPDQPSCLTPDAGLCLDSVTLVGNSTSANIASGACYEVPPKCVESYREEALPTAPPPPLPNLKNFEAVLQVPPHAAPVTYYFFLQPNGDLYDNDGYWADDRDYTILFEHLAEPDSLEGIPNLPRATTLLAAPGGPLVSVPVYLSFGVGQLNPNTNPVPNDVIVGLDDFDGRGNDVDPYQIALPFTTEAAWQISWSVPTSDGVNPDYDLGFTLSFCDTDPDAGTGTPPCYAMVSSPQSNSSDELGLAYSPTPYDSWWNPNASIIPDQVVYTQTISGGVVTTTVTPYGCFCFEPQFVNATATSYFLMNIFPLNRTSWNLVPYTVTTSYSAYPYSFTNTAGGSTTCPDPCDFTIN
ncbi:MAG: hypothetical protein ACLQDQ_17920 [Myxococcaceae bacterium]